jgi:hypothetical protein
MVLCVTEIDELLQFGVKVWATSLSFHHLPLQYDYSALHYPHHHYGSNPLLWKYVSVYKYHQLRHHLIDLEFGPTNQKSVLLT